VAKGAVCTVQEYPATAEKPTLWLFWSRVSRQNPTTFRKLKLQAVSVFNECLELVNSQEKLLIDHIELQVACMAAYDVL